ncbi:MAG: hypothetical protein U0470_08955 [Anaerolineae bacterium]
MGDPTAAVPSRLRVELDRVRARLDAPAESAALRAAWPIAWGALLASPRLGDWDAWPRLAAIGALVWLLEWAAAIHDNQGLDGRVPEGGPDGTARRAAAAARMGAARPLSAGLAVAALLGAWPLLVTLAAVAADGLVVRRTGPGSGRLRDGLRWCATGVGTWLVLEGWTVGPGTASALGASGVDRAIVVAGAARAVRRCRLRRGRGRPAVAKRAIGRPGAPAGRRTARRRPGAWPASSGPVGGGARGGGAWPLWPLRSARPGVRRWAAIAVPALLAVVCAIDAIMP